MTLLYSAFKNPYAAVSYLLMTSVSTLYAEQLFTRVSVDKAPVQICKPLLSGTKNGFTVPGFPSKESGKLGMRIALAW